MPIFGMFGGTAYQLSSQPSQAKKCEVQGRTRPEHFVSVETLHKTQLVIRA